MLFLDCEFDGHKGQLISMALVPHDNDVHFYEVLSHEEIKNEWVKNHVIPVLDKAPITLEMFKLRLIRYLKEHIAEEIVADSPADIIYLMDLMHGIGGDGRYYYETIPLNCLFINSGRLKPEIPHNAVCDAEALRTWYLTHRDIMAHS